MKNKLLKIALSAAALGATIASADVTTTPTTATPAKNAAQFKLYARVTGGVIKPTSTDGLSYNWGGKGNIAFGAAYNAWNVELEFGYYRSNANDDPTDPVVLSAWHAMSGMINLIYNHSFTDTIYAYLGAGVGAASVGYKLSNNVSGSSYGIDDTTFAWQLLGGLGYKINDSWSIQGGYRLFNTTKASMGTAVVTGKSNNMDVKQPFVHNIELGLKYNF
jgi:opacity protein-like surface antigen